MNIPPFYLFTRRVPRVVSRVADRVYNSGTTLRTIVKAPIQDSMLKLWRINKPAPREGLGVSG